MIHNLIIGNKLCIRTRYEIYGRYNHILLCILNGKTATVNTLIAYIRIYIYDNLICTRALYVAITQFERGCTRCINLLLKTSPDRITITVKLFPIIVFIFIFYLPLGHTTMR